VIRRYTVDLDPQAIELGLVLVVCKFDWNAPVRPRLARLLMPFAEIEECHCIAGEEDCILAKIRTKDAQDLNRLLQEIQKSATECQRTLTTHCAHHSVRTWNPAVMARLVSI